LPTKWEIRIPSGTISYARDTTDTVSTGTTKIVGNDGNDDDDKIDKTTRTQLCHAIFTHPYIIVVHSAQLRLG